MIKGSTNKMSKNDLAIEGGRIIDPHSGMDYAANIGVSNGTITEITASKIQADKIIYAKDRIVCPGFIDLHCHPQDLDIFNVQAHDGVTTTLELEVGTDDIDNFYQRWEGKTPINFGSSIGHIPVRMKVMQDPGTFLPSGDAGRREATVDEVEEMKHLLTKGLDSGALAVGFGLDYTRGASRKEIVDMFKIASENKASCHVHLRGKGDKSPNDSIEALQEVIAAAAITNASLHVVHINSTGMKAVPTLLEMIDGARQHGMDISTECYPYSAGMTKIESALFDDGWQEHYGIDYDQLLWPDTGEFLNTESFADYREQGGWVIAFSTPEESVDEAVLNPMTIIATDSIIQEGKGHPRTAGSYTKILGRYVRERGELSWMEAIKKMTIMPADRLSNRAKAFLKKGRISPGADADITIFNPTTVIDTSTYTNPTTAPKGIDHVIVNGIPVISDGNLQVAMKPGKGILSTD